MSMFCDDYGMVNVHYLVYASTLDLPAEDRLGEAPAYLITLMLHVGHMGHACAIHYPQRHLRDTAFEALVALVQRETAEVEDEED
jgi:hypothetical protein